MELINPATGMPFKKNETANAQMLHAMNNLSERTHELVKQQIMMGMLIEFLVEKLLDSKILSDSFQEDFLVWGQEREKEMKEAVLRMQEEQASKANKGINLDE